MITVKLKGGLGNQMFQYALGRVISLKHGTELRVDASSFGRNSKKTASRKYNLDVFNIKAEVASSFWDTFFLRLLKKIKEKSFSFDPNVLSAGDGVYLDGYWQSPKYFEGFEEIIRKDFTLRSEPSKNIKDMAEEISNSDSLCMHIRRTDYVGNAFYELADQEYYKKGLEHIAQKSAVSKIYVFSDDLSWCRSNLSFDIPTVFVGSEYAGLKDEGHMHLMSHCKNFIIANSSFSWWGAWLSSREGKIVICPQKWFGDDSIDTNDLIPKEWIRI